MDTPAVLTASSILALLVALTLGALLLRQRRLHQRQTRQVHAERLRQIQCLRDTQNIWLQEGVSSDPQALLHAIAAMTPLQGWWLDADSKVATEAQVEHAPFCVVPHLASMALHNGRTVHQHQLAQWAWASTYVPVRSPCHPHAVLMLASTTALSATDHAYAAAMAETLCNAWAHAPTAHADPAINPA